MKILVRIAIMAFFLLNALPHAGADVVYLKNGRQLNGIIAEENEEYVELMVGFGSIKFYRAEIERLERSSQEEKERIEQIWEDERIRQAVDDAKLAQEAKVQEETLPRKEEKASPKIVEVMRKGGHIFVNALLNKTVNAKLLVDTGASLVVLSPKVAGELNIDLTNSANDIKMILADGTEVPAKLIKLDAVSVEEAAVQGIDAVVIYKENAFAGFDGVLGMSFLRLFKFAVNVEQNKLTLEKL
jgi:clan AA aspartic protease (TIGR02281 family)